MSRQSLIDSMTLKLMRDKGMSLDEAAELAESLAEDVPEVPEAPAQPEVPLYSNENWPARKGTDQVAAKYIQRVVGPDGLTDGQRIGLSKGIALCPNCQQPETTHLPGCSRIPGVGSDARARTEGRLPPAV